MFRFCWLAFMALLIPACSAAPFPVDQQTTLRCDNCRTTPVLGIVDGDTLNTLPGRIRLFGVDTPERGERCYKEAKGRLRALAGNRVRVEPGPRDQDRGGRLLLYVYTESGISIDETLIREGLAVAWTRDGQHRDLLVALAKEAQTTGTGCLW